MGTLNVSALEASFEIPKKKNTGYVSMEEWDLIEKVKEGDEAAFGKIYDKYYRMVASIIRKVGRCPQSEIDFHLNEVFFRIYKGIFRFKGKSKFSTYCYRIGLNYAYQLSSKVRKDQLLHAELDENLPSDGTHFEEHVEHREIAETILEMLSPKLRSVTVLYYYDSLPVKEIAEIEGISENAVKNRLFQARKKIKESMDGQGLSFD